MYDVKFEKNHGTKEKGQTVSYHKTTAKALQAHGIVKIIGKTPLITVVENDVKKQVFDIKK